MRFGRITIAAIVATVLPLSIGARTAHAAVTINEFQSPATIGPNGIAVGPDGNLWIAGGNNKIWKMSTAGIFLNGYTVPTASAAAYWVTSGPDGNLWFAEDQGDKIGRITTAGVMTEFPLPSGSHRPEAITLGPDCDLWFVEEFPAKVGHITTSGKITEFPLSSISLEPSGITAGPDGNLWFTEYGGQKIGRITPTGTITEFPIDTSAGLGGGGPDAITEGWDGNLWFTMDVAHMIGRITPSGTLSYFLQSTPNGAVSTGITHGPDGNVWFTDASGNAFGEITPAGLIAEGSVPSASASPQGIVTGPDGYPWFAEFGTGKVAQVFATGTLPPGTPRDVAAYAGDGSAMVSWNAPFYNGGAAITSYTVTPYIGATAQTPVTVSASPASITGLTNGTTYTFRVTATNSTGTGFPSCFCGTVVTPSALQRAVSSNQYSLTGNNGSTWVDIDASKLYLNISPSVSSTAVLGGNADLWTANAGFNQDIGIFVSVNGGPDTLVAWKESGGFAGTFSPNAAFVQGVYDINAGTTYVFKLKWKTNKNAPGATIFAGAGPIAGAYSPTRLTAQLVSTTTNVVDAVSTQQYVMTGSNGSTWADLDATNLKLSVTPVGPQVAVLGANADLWTANAGYNQDIAIFVSVDGGADTLVAWKESGGFAGTFSPNAAFVHSLYNVTSGHTYVFKLKWKTNKNASGATIVDGAGPISAQFSPTRLTMVLMPPSATHDLVSAAQYQLTSSNGTAWALIDGTNLVVSIVAGADEYALVGGNADLWTANAGYNQDVAIYVSVDGGADQLVTWKESGGFAGTFSPNAAFVQGVYRLSSGSTYVFTLTWKTNKNAPGATIVAGAGPISGLYSPTRMSIELIS